MSIPVLATKLYIPPPPPKAVTRPRLIERLNEGLQRKLTLIAAPAGFGKTSLLSEWLVACGRPVAWLALDQDDHDCTRFLTYLVAALQTITPAVGQSVLEMLQSPQPPPVEWTLTTLLNDITATPNHFIVVLDDYHMVDAKPVDVALTFLVEHLPPQMHLVIATREDPDLPLARLRARGQLTELRAADLRFTLSETAEFLNQGMGLSLTVEDVAALEARTEGWIAGLQLAALSMQGQQDMPGFVRAFAGDHRYILDYLVEEVLQRQPEPVRSFLLQTAILDRLNGSLCDAVTGQEQGNARLEALERGNFFVVPLDDKRNWYRYHHLFAQVLYAHLMAEQPAQAPALHRRASEWYEQHGSASDAIRHALAGGDFERAANLIELAVPEMRRSRQEAMVLGWLKMLPDELIRCRPMLSVGYAWTLLAVGELEGVEARLRDAEQISVTAADRSERPEALPETSPGVGRRMVVVDKEEFRHLPGMIAIYRAGVAQVLGDVTNTVKYAHQALDLFPEENHLGRGAAAGFLGLAYWTKGELEAAHRSYADCLTRVQKGGHISDAIGCATALADIRIAQGRLREAMSTYERGLQLATEQGASPQRGVADMYVGMSELLRERNDLDAARQHLLKSQELGEHMGLPQNRYRWRVAMARIREAEGDLDGALDLLREAERLYVSDFFPNVRPVPALKTRVWVAQGKLGEALGWARERGLSTHDDLSYLREFEHITLVRILVAQYKNDHANRSLLEAMGLLERLLRAAEAGQRIGSEVEILVLHALAYQMQGDIPAALAPLARALTLAEPEGYVRTFTGEGPSMAALLEKAVKQGIAPNYAGQLLRSFGKNEDRTPAKQGLIEPLSERELAVLRLLGTDLDGPEMARELRVSLNTLRTHTKNIYSKLGVNSRRAAVRRAEELDLF
jgi:LuxR family maltose regulon positive regulatory protein